MFCMLPHVVFVVVFAVDVDVVKVRQGNKSFDDMRETHTRAMNHCTL